MPVLLVVEDNIRYYSSFLPVIYTELIKQSRRVIQEGINVAHKLVRMQARPKILLTSNFEDAAQVVQQYREHLLGVVSDVEFPMGWRSLARKLASSWRAWSRDWCRMCRWCCKPAARNFAREPTPKAIRFCANARRRC